MSYKALTPDALAMMDVIARTGSFAAAARELGKVPSALTYSVRQLEEALDVLLFDRRSRQAEFTAAGAELLLEGRRLLEEMEAVAHRVKRIATGWESQLSIAVDGVISRATMFELCEAFYSLSLPPTDRASGGSEPRRAPTTRLRLRTAVMMGTWEALVTGQVDLAIGIAFSPERNTQSGFQMRPLGEVSFVFVVAPHHPLANAAEPISDAELIRHRAVAVADSAQRMTPASFNMLAGQDVLTVPSTAAKIEAQIRGLGCGYLPEPLAREPLAAGRLVRKATIRCPNSATLGYAWRQSGGDDSQRAAAIGLGLRWWLDQLESPPTQQALLEQHTRSWPALVD